VPWRKYSTGPALGVFSASFSMRMASFSNRSMTSHVNTIRFGVNGRRTSSTDDLALLLRLVNALEAAKEELGTVDDGQVDTEVLVEGLLDLLALVEAHDA
jgi:hypothetical protein